MDGIKVCTKCGISKSLTEFGTRKHRSGRYGPNPFCRECDATRHKETRRKDPEHVRAIERKSEYGITTDQFNEILALQGGRCAICLEEFGTTRVDHDPKTGAVRGILCHGCNVKLGLYKDDPEILRSKGYNEAAWYIERANER